jgi:tetratricopeptide (TPR) repeat protein
MRIPLLILTCLSALIIGSCHHAADVTPNPWLVPGDERFESSVSRSQMRAMYRLAGIYNDAGLHYEYIHALTTAVELFAGDIDITFQLLNELIGSINNTLDEVARQKSALTAAGIDPSTLSRDNGSELSPQEALYLDTKDKLEAQYEECYRILKNACWQIPYNTELYYRTADLQFLRAEADEDPEKYKDAIAYLKRAIATDSSSLQSYRLIAITYERLGEPDLAIRFWRLFEVIYEIAPEIKGEGFITPEIERMHEEALEHLETLGAQNESDGATR